jgi:hypothetical protein
MSFAVIFTIIFCWVFFSPYSSQPWNVIETNDIVNNISWYYVLTLLHPKQAKANNQHRKKKQRKKARKRRMMRWGKKKSFSSSSFDFFSPFIGFISGFFQLCWTNNVVVIHIHNISTEISQYLWQSYRFAYCLFLVSVVNNVTRQFCWISQNILATSLRTWYVVVGKSRKVYSDSRTKFMKLYKLPLRFKIKSSMKNWKAASET